MRSVRYSVVMVLTLLVGCTDFPDLDNAITENGRSATYPRLVQLDGFASASTQDTDEIRQIAKSLAFRARALRKRARALRGPVVDRRTRADLAAALARHPIAVQP